jgi:N-acetylglucosamine kinase-like BadF-type ATPase
VRAPGASGRPDPSPSRQNEPSTDEQNEPDDHLTPLLLDALAVDTPPGLITAVYGRRLDRTTLAGLAPLVAQAAQAGDPRASAILSQAAHDLAAIVEAVFHALSDPPWPSLPLALAGGFLLGCDSVRDEVLALLADRLPVPVHAQAVPDPVAGAVILALKELGS